MADFEQRKRLKRNWLKNRHPWRFLSLAFLPAAKMPPKALCALL
jgi:hypothetical protein